MMLIQEHSLSQNHSLGIWSVLILEDNELDRHRFRRACKRFSGGIILLDECTTLADFRAAVARKRYDLIVVDYSLPDGAGFDAPPVCRSVAQNADAKMIMVTGYCRDAIEDAALQSGFSDFVGKDGRDFDLIFERNFREF